MKTAHFFWEGTLSLYEMKCIESFVNKGFDVNVWSYQTLNLPSNVKLLNAENILPKEKLKIFSQGGNKENIAAFSDVFRFNVLHKEGGWWFDTDCFCLKDVEEFIELTNNRNIVAGFENKSKLYTACGVIYFKDSLISKLFLDELNSRCIIYNNDFPKWGTIGPKMFSDVIIQNNFVSDILDEKCFYPIHYRDIDLFYKKETSETLKVIKDSFVLHLWNEIIRKKQIDKNKYPPNESMLYNLFEQKK
jgi:hypothetical protein